MYRGWQQCFPILGIRGYSSTEDQHGSMKLNQVSVEEETVEESVEVEEESVEVESLEEESSRTIQEWPPNRTNYVT